MQTSALEPAVTLDDIAHLDAMMRELGVASSVADQQIKRLIMAGFGNPVRADHNLRKLLREEGVESAIRVLEDRASRPRWHYLGFPRGRLPERMQGLWMPKGMIAPRAQEALRELPTALREYATVRTKLLDLQNSRTELRARVPGRAPLSVTRTPDRQNERSR